ncbi:MAG TPA: tRNA preQ1(34) S-adenosylmethionine ribosyltransferase-isomerase QueA [Candidatus Eisenbacteria bacterium]
MKTSDFDYDLPPDRIAQHPAPERDLSRLLVLDRATGAIAHRLFRDLPEFIRPGDLLIVNDTRVLPARIFARAPRAAGCATPREVEVLLLREEPAVPPERIWSALARPARLLRIGVPLSFVDASWTATVAGAGARGVRRIAFRPGAGTAAPAGDTGSFEAWLARVGHVPLPPYIARNDEPEDRERYQTVFARESGSVAAPTAGLHFTEATLAAVRSRGAAIASVTLHVGPGTFRPVSTDDPAKHVLDPEPYRVPPKTAAAIGSTKARRGRVIAVGTTSVRALESWARDGEPADGAWRDTALFVVPPFDFRVIDAMITNFHLPRSSLLFLVSALAGRERILAAYAEAVREGYRFYSYGDAMLLV